LIEFTGIDPQAQDLRFNLIYQWDPKNDVFHSNGKSVLIEKIMERRNWDEHKLESELKDRKNILEHMAEKGLDEFDAISLIHDYYLYPEKTLSNIKL
jgi:archaeal flagellar protein FlaI